MPVCLSVCLSVCLCVCLSVCLSAVDGSSRSSPLASHCIHSICRQPNCFSKICYFCPTSVSSQLTNKHPHELTSDNFQGDTTTQHLLLSPLSHSPVSEVLSFLQLPLKSPNVKALNCSICQGCPSNKIRNFTDKCNHKFSQGQE